LYVIALLVKKSGVDVDSKQVVKNNLLLDLFPDKNAAYRHCRPNNRHVDMLS